MKYTGERVIPELMKDKVKIYQHHLSRYIFALPYARDRKVLDASCGSGYGTDLLYDVANDILGIDVSKEAIDYEVREMPFSADEKWREIYGTKF